MAAYNSNKNGGTSTITILDTYLRDLVMEKGFIHFPPSMTPLLAAICFQNCVIMLAPVIKQET